MQNSFINGFFLGFSLILAIATCIGRGALGLEIVILGFLIFGADLPDDEFETDLPDFKGPLMDTRFAAFSSGLGEAGLFFPPILPVNFPPPDTPRLAAVGSEGRLALLPPPFIFSENIFLHVTKNTCG